MGSSSSTGAKFGTFVFGFFFGIVVSGIGAFVIARYMMQHPQAVMSKAHDLGMDQVVEHAVEKSVEKTVAAIPQDMVAVRQQDINQTVQNLTQAYSENRITPTDMQLIAGKFFGMMADQKITPQEMDEMLSFMNQMAK